METEAVKLVEACGRVLAGDITSGVSVPPFDRAAMDGYAVVAEDTFKAGKFNPVVLDCVEKVYTGQIPENRVSSGRCAEIATGAVMPEGADGVVMVEDTEKGADGRINIYKPIYPGENLSRQGEDISPGATVLHAGEVLNPGKIGALAALGIAEAEVFKKPEMLVIPTGDEIAGPGGELKKGQIYNINSYTLGAVINEHGGLARLHPVVDDEREAVEKSIRDNLSYQVIIFTGGSSVGTRDVIGDVIEGMGEVFFHGVAVKPGKPTLLGKVEDTLVIGMPGYPTSCLSNGYMILLPILRRMAHLPPVVERRVIAELERRLTSTIGRHQFYTVKLIEGKAHPAFKESGSITSMSDADGYIEIPAHVDLLEKGEEVEVKLL
jgi:molybdenum cofactor synthesis domain-containing protein